MPIRDPRLAPRYSRAEVSGLLAVPAGTVGNWVRGYDYPVQGRTRHAKPLVVAPRGYHELSFTNLVEAHTIAAFRASGVSMQRIRPALAYLAGHVAVEHLLASKLLLTDGVDVFYEYVRKTRDGELTVLLNISKGGQAAFAEVIKAYLERIDWASDGFATKLWPTDRSSGISIDPRRGFGFPIIDRRAVRVDHVAGRLEAGESIRSVARDYGLTAREVTTAEEFVESHRRHAA